jgi:hypothetical protein
MHLLAVFNLFTNGASVEDKVLGTEVLILSRPMPNLGDGRDQTAAAYITQNGRTLS